MREEIGKGNKGVTSVKRNWNLEVEISKVIEKGVALGFLNIRNSKKSKESAAAIVDSNKSGSWNLSAEVAKVIETRIARV